jgi:hypothetical protein
MLLSAFSLCVSGSDKDRTAIINNNNKLNYPGTEQETDVGLELGW